MEIDFNQYNSLKESAFFNKNFNITNVKMHNYTFLAFNLRKEPFSNPLFRKAAAHAIDRAAIIRDILKNNAEIATGPFPSMSWASNPQITPHEYSPKEARRLLIECGFSLPSKNSSGNDEGFLNYKGRPFSITILTNKGESAREETSRAAAQYLKAAGLNANVLAVTWKSLIKKHIGKRQFDALVLGWSLDPDPDCYSMWHSSESGPDKLNFSGYSNPETDKLIMQGRSIFNREKRRAIYHKIHSIFHEEQPCVFLYSPMSMIAVNKRFENTVFSPLGFFNFLYEWTVNRKD
jgi:peptide/nickel transport system substrate-binding protein